MLPETIRLKGLKGMGLKVMLPETIRNDDF